MAKYIIYQQIKGMFWVPGLGTIKSQDAPQIGWKGEPGEGVQRKNLNMAGHNVSNVQNHHEILIVS